MKEKFQESLQSKISELMEDIQEQEKQAAHTQEIHTDQLNEQETRHYEELLKRNLAEEELRENFTTREH